MPVMRACSVVLRHHVCAFEQQPYMPYHETSPQSPASRSDEQAPARPGGTEKPTVRTERLSSNASGAALFLALQARQFGPEGCASPQAILIYVFSRPAQIAARRRR